MSMVNAKPRFGLENGRLYDYKRGLYLTVSENLVIEDEGGSWDAMKVVKLINEGKSIESAFTKREAVPAMTTIAQANADFTAKVDEMIASDTSTKPEVVEVAEAPAAETPVVEAPAE